MSIRKIQAEASGYELHREKSFWAIVAPQVGQNLFPDPSWENPTSANLGNPGWVNDGATVALETTSATHGSQCIAITPTGGNFGAYFQDHNNTYLNLSYNTPYTWSLDFKGVAGVPYRAIVRSQGFGQFATGSTIFIGSATGQWQHLKTTFIINDPTGPYDLEFEILADGGGTGAAYKFYTDSWQIEAGSIETSYMDGDQPGCTWDTSIAHFSPTTRSRFGPGGKILNFKTDFNFSIYEEDATGLLPLENQYTPLGLENGDQLDRTSIKRRLIILTGAFEGDKLADIKAKKKALEAIVTPDVITGTPAALLLRYQLLDDTGAVYKTLDVPVTYISGLEGKTTNILQERATLIFSEDNPPQIREYFPTITALGPGLVQAVGGNPYWRFKRNPRTGWTGAPTMSNNVADGSLQEWVYNFDKSGHVYAGLGNNASAGNFTIDGVRYLNTNHNVRAILVLPNGTTWVGGQFSTPYAFLGFSTNPFSVGFTAAAPAFNNSVWALVQDNLGNIYAGGDFTSPGTRLAKLTPPNTWAALGTGANNTVRGMLALPDNTILIYGIFSTMNGITVNGVCKYNPTTNTFSAMGTGVTQGGPVGQVFAAAVGKDGRVYIGGIFDTAGGVAANNIAVWNGSQWLPLGRGLDAAVTGLVMDRSGVLWVGGIFSNVGTGAGAAYGITNNLVKWNGSNFLPAGLEAVAQSNGFRLGLDLTDSLLVASSVSATSFRYEQTTTLNNSGTAGVQPKLLITGDSRIRSIFNYTTGKGIYFDYTLQAGEILTIEFTNPGVTISSNVSLVGIAGPTPKRVIPGSALSSFGLIPGDNLIGVQFNTGTPANQSVKAIYYPTHLSFNVT